MAGPRQGKTAAITRPEESLIDFSPRSVDEIPGTADKNEVSREQDKVETYY